MRLPARLPTPRLNGLDGVLAVAAVAAVVGLSVAANARRRVGRRVAALRSGVDAHGSAEQTLAEPVTGS